MTDALTPFRLQIPDAQLDDLRERLRRTRWPETETVGDWSQGVPLAYVRDLCDYWADEYDWRATEARLNRLPQYRTEIDGLGIHVWHVRSPHPDALPLIMTHGWPGSLVEFEATLGPLTDPPAHGGDAADAFHVVCPALPGYGFSDKPAGPGWGVHRIADAWSTLMARLGYERYGAQGGDWGSSITTLLSLQDPEHVAGIHLNQPLATPDPATFDDLTDAELAALDSMRHAREWENGYAVEQSTRPQTVGYGLVDSPAALCAWIIEKFWSWTDCGGHPENAVPRDALLDNLMFYWLTSSGASSARLYWESMSHVRDVLEGTDTEPVTVPTGVSMFPKERLRPSRRWAQRRFTDLRHWNELDRGGHFPALEQPEIFVDDVRTFFRSVR